MSMRYRAPRINYRAIKRTASRAASAAVRRANRRKGKFPMWAWLVAAAAAVYFFFWDKVKSMFGK